MGPHGGRGVTSPAEAKFVFARLQFGYKITCLLFSESRPSKNGPVALCGQFADGQNWSIRESKLKLSPCKARIRSIHSTRSARARPDLQKPAKLVQVFRGSSTHWNESQIYDALIEGCKETSRTSSTRLISNLISNPGAETLVRHLEYLRNLKVVSYYPTTAVSKFSHFFNPSLFPIYDTEIVFRTVINGKFRDDWKSFNPRTSPLLIMDDKDPIWDASYWVAWGSEIMRRRHPELMDVFAEWFLQVTMTADDDVGDLHGDLNTYYATAFRVRRNRSVASRVVNIMDTHFWARVELRTSA